MIESSRPDTWHNRALLFCTICTIALSGAFSLTYAGIQTFNVSDVGGYTDSLKYIAMYRGERVTGHWGYRIVTPYLAAALPDPPAWLFSPKRAINEEWIAKVKFGIVNLVFLAGTSVLLFYYLGGFGFSFFESIAGMLLFLTALPVVYGTAIPMVDASSFFFLLLCLIAIHRECRLILVLSFSLGLFAKETTILVLPMIALSNLPRKGRIYLTLMPALIGYFTFRFVLYPNPEESVFNLMLVKAAYQQLLSAARPNKVLDLFSSFGLLWIPATYAYFKCQVPTLLKRWILLLPLILAMIMLLRGNLGRILFLSFPIVIPLALLGIRQLLQPAGCKSPWELDGQG